jgi:hypothetical protein
VHSAVLAFDPMQWELVRFTLLQHADPDTDDATERYEVLHLSSPHAGQLAFGRGLSNGRRTALRHAATAAGADQMTQSHPPAPPPPPPKLSQPPP